MMGSSNLPGKRILREIAILSKLKHEYIVRLYDIVRA